MNNELTIKVIHEYIDVCLAFATNNKEYLMYVPFYEGDVEQEMLDTIDISAITDKPMNIKLIQKGRSGHIIDLVSDKDTIWKMVDNTVTNNQISILEKDLNIVLPYSYKEYLKYKHHYKIFYDLNVSLYPKPIGSWSKILMEKSLSTKEFILDKGYFPIGNYSDFGEVAIKLSNNPNDEGEVVMFDYETGEVSKTLAYNFIGLLDTILALPQPEFIYLSDAEKRLSGLLNH
jgi:hypothetical protein